MRVTVVIVGFRNATDVVHCLLALGRQTHRAFEVVVVENGGDEAFVDVRSRAPAVLEGGQSVTVLTPAPISASPAG